MRQKMRQEEIDHLQKISDLETSEDVKCCPECKEKNILSTVKRLQYEEDRYWVICTKEDECSYLQEFQGSLTVTKEELNQHRLPGELADHMDIYHEDINKIVRFCMSEYIKVIYLPILSPDSNSEIKDCIKSLVESHGLGISNPCVKINNGITSSAETCVSDASVKGNSDTILADPCFEYGQCSQPIKLYKQESSEVEKMLLDLQGFSDFKQISQIDETDQSHLTAEGVQEDLTHLFQNFVNEPLQKLLNESGQEKKVQCKYKKTRKCFPNPRIYKPFDLMRKLSDSLVADLSTTYQETLKVTFAKIKEYKFPHDFGNNLTI